MFFAKKNPGKNEIAMFGLLALTKRVDFEFMKLEASRTMEQLGDFHVGKVGVYRHA